VDRFAGQELTRRKPSAENHSMPADPLPQAVEAAHAIYCRLTGQNLSLRFDRLRLWSDFFQAGFTSEDLQWVVAYLQKEIRAGRRNVGALKLRNLLAPDRFEEDLSISRVRLRPKTTGTSTPPPPPPIRPSPAEEQRLREEATRTFQRLRVKLRLFNPS
jgi:hypothetical protein